MAKSIALTETKPMVFAQHIRDLIAGRSNAVGTCTLADGETTTTVTAINCGADSKVFLFPTSATAAAAIASGDLYISAVAGGSFEITHDNTADVDRTFFWVCLG